MKLSEIIEDLSGIIETLENDVDDIDRTYGKILDGEAPGFLKNRKDIIDEIKEKLSKAFDSLDNISNTLSECAAELTDELDNYEPDGEDDL